MERKLLYKLKFGSHLYGLQTPESDIDYVSIIMPQPRDLLGLQVLEEIDNSSKKSSENRKNNKDDIDDKAYTLNRFLHLLLDGNPSLTEIMFSHKENIEFEHPIITELKSFKDEIISNRVKKSFLGFAFSQKQKLLVKSTRYFSLRKAIGFLEARFSGELLTDKADVYELSEEQLTYLNSILEYYKGEKHNVEHFHKGMSLRIIYEKIKKEYDEYGWRVKTKDFENLKYDPKFGYHSIRLLMEGLELISTGSLTFPIPQANHNILMNIKTGLVSYEELIELYDTYEGIIKDTNSVLPEKPNFNKVNDWLIEVLLNEFKGF